MSETILSDLNLVITDKVMKNVYRSEFLDLSKTNIIDKNKIARLNLYSTPEEVIGFKSELKDYFYLIAGSSNFHHIDIANISRIKNKLNQKIQLILFDNHTDCLKYEPKSNFLHCGNWVSYAYQKEIIEKIIMVGTGDWRKIKGFDFSIVKNNDLQYQPDVNGSINLDFLNLDLPVYISIDTDIINKPSDWGKGQHNLYDVINSQIWDQLSKMYLVGASIMGHVTENRYLLDLIKSVFKIKSNMKTFYSISEIYNFYKNCVYNKLRATSTKEKISLNEQLEIILAFYHKIQSIQDH